MGDVLILGCGPKPYMRRLSLVEKFPPYFEDDKVTGIDMSVDAKPDVLHDLRVKPWPLADDSFDEVHAYDLLEHLGTQGDFVTFFSDYWEIWRVLRPHGYLYAMSPAWNSEAAWCDPGHTRVIGSPITLSFLSQEEYTKQIGLTSMTDYRWLWKKDFRVLTHDIQGGTFVYVLEKLPIANSQD